MPNATGRSQYQRSEPGAYAVAGGAHPPNTLTRESAAYPSASYHAAGWKWAAVGVLAGLAVGAVVCNAQRHHDRVVVIGAPPPRDDDGEGGDDDD